MVDVWCRGKEDSFRKVAGRKNTCLVERGMFYIRFRKEEKCFVYVARRKRGIFHMFQKRRGMFLCVA